MGLACHISIDIRRNVMGALLMILLGVIIVTSIGAWVLKQRVKRIWSMVLEEMSQTPS